MDLFFRGQQIKNGQGRAALDRSTTKCYFRYELQEPHLLQGPVEEGSPLTAAFPVVKPGVPQYFAERSSVPSRHRGARCEQNSRPAASRTLALLPAARQARLPGLPPPALPCLLAVSSVRVLRLLQEAEEDPGPGQVGLGFSGLGYSGRRIGLVAPGGHFLVRGAGSLLAPTKPLTEARSGGLLGHLQPTGVAPRNVGRPGKDGGRRNPRPASKG